MGFRGGQSKSDLDLIQDYNTDLVDVVFPDNNGQVNTFSPQFSQFHFP
jgi:hypothetical protein